MNFRGAMTVVVSVCVVGALAACENTAGGTPTPESGASSGTTRTSPTDPDRLVPPIDDPKDLTTVDPCELLTASQLAGLTVTASAVKEKSLWGEDKCTWRNSKMSVGLAPDTRRDGLEGDYQNQDDFDNFKESEVDGYPAARVDFASEGCGVIVGVADDQALTVHYGRGLSDAPGEGDPCGFAESIASMVLTNLPDA